MLTIDKRNLNDPNKIAIYGKDIFKYYKEEEGKYLFKFTKNYSENINFRYNSIDKIFEIIDKMGYSDDTLYLSIYIFDFYLNYYKSKIDIDFILNLLITSIFIAAKFQEITYITLDRILRRLNKKDINFEILKYDIMEMEHDILFSMQFNLNIINNNDILKRIIMMEKIDNQYYVISSYLLELCLYHPLYFSFLSSERAISTLIYVLKFYGVKLDLNKIKFYFNYNENRINDFQVIINKMRLLQEKRKLNIVDKLEEDKYTKKKIKDFYELKLF